MGTGDIGSRGSGAGRAAEPRLGAGLPVRPDRGRAGPEAAQHRRRAHAGGARDRGRQEHHRRRHGLNARGDRRPARDGACGHPLRQRARAHGQRPARLVPVLRHRQQLHRARRAVGEPIRRVVQRPVARRVPGRRAVRQPARGAGGFFMSSSSAMARPSVASFNPPVGPAATPVRTSRRPGRTTSR